MEGDRVKVEKFSNLFMTITSVVVRKAVFRCATTHALATLATTGVLSLKHDTRRL